MDLPLLLSYENLSQYIPYLLFKYCYDSYLYCKSVMDLNITKLIKETGKLIKICIYPDNHDFPGHEFLIILPRGKNDILYLVDSYIANCKITSFTLTTEKLIKLFNNIEEFSTNPTPILWENITKVKELYMPKKIFVDTYVWNLPHLNAQHINNNMETLKIDGIKNTKKKC